MQVKHEIMFPVGRMVEGNLYSPNETDAEGNPLTYKTGSKAGQQRVDYYMALAIAKGSEQHWAHTEWGQKLWNIGHQIFINGATQSPTFLWKVTDGDSVIPNANNRRPCDKEGFKGHWVIRFSNGFAPTIVNRDGSANILEENYINAGDFVQVFAYIVDNTSKQQPGLKINHRVVSFQAYGDRIVFGPDPKTLGFGQQALPTGASVTPKAGMTNPPQVAQPPSAAPSQPYTPPLPNAQAVSATQAYIPPSPAIQAITPHLGILNPQPGIGVPAPITPVPVRRMTAKAGAYTYEQFVATGNWTDELLIRDGYMEP